MHSNILMVYPAFTPSVRLCGYEQLKHLASAGKINFSHKSAFKITSDDCKMADIIIFVRSETATELAIAKKYKGVKKLIYILDDDLLNVPLGMNSSAHYNNKGIKKRISKILSFCDMIISPSKKILEKYGAGKTTMAIEQPSLAIQDNFNKNDKIRIGFAGSYDRASDIENIMETALIDINKTHSNLEFYFFGGAPSFADKLSAKTIPYQSNYNQYRKTMAEINLDIGLAPMSTSDFASFKHYNKLTEYSSFGIVGIYSNLPPYDSCIIDGVNGFLVENTDESWTNTLKELIADYDKLFELRKNCKDYALEHFSIEKTSTDYYEILPSEKSTSKDSISLIIPKAKTFINKSTLAVRTYGLALPKKLLKRG